MTFNYKNFYFEIKLGCTLLVVFFLLLLWIYFFPPKVSDLYETTNQFPSFSEIRNDLRTGDLILLSGNTYGEKMIRWGTNCPWNHIGMVVVPTELHLKGVKPYDINKIYIWECDIGQGYKSGVRLIPLGIKLHKWRHGRRIGAWMRLESNDSSLSYENLFPLIEKQKGKTVETNYKSYLLPEIMRENKENRDSYYCSELVALTYQHFDLISLDKDPRSFSPSDFFNRTVDMKSETKLLEPVLFKF